MVSSAPWCHLERIGRPIIAEVTCMPPVPPWAKASRGSKGLISGMATALRIARGSWFGVHPGKRSLAAAPPCRPFSRCSRSIHAAAPLLLPVHRAVLTRSNSARSLRTARFVLELDYCCTSNSDKADASTFVAVIQDNSYLVRARHALANSSDDGRSTSAMTLLWARQADTMP